jgi:hypothetical protein
MKHTMKSPCERCPFRSDLPHGYLRADRIQEIAASLFRGGSFPCHKTTIESEEDEDGFCDMEANSDSEQCAGAEIFLAKQGMSTQLSRIAERLGMKVSKLDMKAPVCGSVVEMLEVHGVADEIDVETCSVCDYGCEAPAGYAAGDGVIHGTDAAEYSCYECGEPVCGNCSVETEDGRVCKTCKGDDE